jgi:hypothetical protein
MDKQKRWMIGAVAILLAMTVFSCQKQSNTTGSNTVSLFNGKNLKGLQRHGKGKWFVDKEGNLVGESGPSEDYSYLATDKGYQNFVLNLQFKQKTNGNSGVFFHCTFSGKDLKKGWQTEVAPPGHNTAGIYESYGRGWLAKPDSSKDSVLQMGKWNKMKVRVSADTVDTWLNGTHMVHLVDRKIGAHSGPIALQMHKGNNVGVRFKHIKLTEL